MCFFVYILKNSSGKFYTGQTNDLENRIVRHNSGFVRSTRAGIVWKLVYSTKVNSRLEALLLEKRIKKRGAQRYLNGLKR
jgi:putative endonuclease